MALKPGGLGFRSRTMHRTGMSRSFPHSAGRASVGQLREGGDLIRVAHPMDESKDGVLRLNFDRRLKLEFHGSRGHFRRWVVPV